MRFSSPLIAGRLVKRYKRFLADIVLDNGEEITAHTANPGSMMSGCPEGARVWVSKSTSKTRKLPYSWELVEITEFDRPSLVCVNTGFPNKIAEEAVSRNLIPELAGYEKVTREVKYGENSRIDLLLESGNRPPCYVEVKNVSLRRSADGLAEFPDSVTARGLKHLGELQEMARSGNRAVMLFILQRADCTSFSAAADIDPKYAAKLDEVHQNGVEILVWDCEVTTSEVVLRRPLPFISQA